VFRSEKYHHLLAEIGREQGLWEQRCPIGEMGCSIAGKREPHLTVSECSGVRSITICWLKLVESKDCGSKEMDWRVLDERYL